MKPLHYIHVFAGISITALCFQIFSDFWLPLAIGAASAAAIAVFIRR